MSELNDIGRVNFNGAAPLEGAACQEGICLRVLNEFEDDENVAYIILRVEIESVGGVKVNMSARQARALAFLIMSAVEDVEKNEDLTAWSYRGK